MNARTDAIRQIAQSHPDHQPPATEIDTIFGIAINEQLGDAIIVTVIATGFEQDNEPDEPKQVKPQPRVGNPGVRTEPQQSGRGAPGRAGGGSR